MRALTENQRAFVMTYLETGGTNATRAAIAAGYGGSDGSAAVAAHRLVHNPKVQAAIKEIAEGRIRAGVLLGASVLLEIAGDPGHKDRLRAAEALMDRGGMLLVRETKVTVEHKDPSVEATIARIRMMAEAMNMDPRPLLTHAGVPQDIIDAEFSVVQTTPTEDDEWTVHPA